MNTTICDLHNFVWLDYASIGHPAGHAFAIELFRDSVVRPSLRAIDLRIEEIEQSDDESAAFLRDDMADLFQATVEAYLLAVQSMWERALRTLLIERDKRLSQGSQRAALERAQWSGGRKDLQHHFERLLGVPVVAFDSFEDLDLLQNLGSAIRHGDGSAARKVHERAPSLWWNWAPPGTSYDAGLFRVDIPADWPAHPSFRKVTLPEEVLEQMIQAVEAFWVDLENMRCNSLREKSPSVQRQLAAWPAERVQRVSARLWTPG